MLFTEEEMLLDDENPAEQESSEPSDEDLEEMDLDTDLDEDEIFNLENTTEEDDDYLD